MDICHVRVASALEKGLYFLVNTYLFLRNSGWMGSLRVLVNILYERPRQKELLKLHWSMRASSLRPWSKRLLCEIQLDDIRRFHLVMSSFLSNWPRQCRKVFFCSEKVLCHWTGSRSSLSRIRLLPSYIGKMCKYICRQKSLISLARAYLSEIVVDS